MSSYEPNTIEKKWNEEWFKHNLYEAVDFDPKPKKYILAELPYPSGKSLHAGHMMRYTVPDIYSRYLRMKGFNVLFPMGWDAFGLPAENYAIKTGVHPGKFIHETIDFYKLSIRAMGYSIDWNREIDTTDPNYYKWTQWIFLKLLKANLAKYQEAPVWWCETLKIVLSDEEVLTDKNGQKVSEREGHPVVRKNFTQWILEITKYADKLLEGLNEIDFPESIKSAQRNWIGRKEGINISYKIDGLNDQVVCFTTRPDTNFGATFVVIAPEHALVEKLNSVEIKNYVKSAKNKSELERIAEGRAKTGVFTGLYAINGLNNRRLPIWISDFVINDFGTGAIVGVPGHDKRDFEFATKFGLPVIRVVVGNDGDNSEITKLEQIQEESGTMINSESLNGLDIHEATKRMTAYLEQKGMGNRTKIYSMRDWLFSRQRYWGEPIPVVHKQDGSIESLCDPDNAAEVASNLPLKLPDVPDYNPTSDGSSPLEKNKEWITTTDKSGNSAKRETNTMPQWAGSCWYYIRYLDSKNNTVFADEKILKYWLPVDRYFGGAEHTTLHLLYSRFWHRFLYDQGLVPTKEPYAWRMNGGILLGPDGRKMSKSLGNVVEPQALIDNYGADALRMFIAFLGPYDETYPWNENGIKATSRLLKTIYDLQLKVDKKQEDSLEINRSLHIAIKNISSMLENLKMNTAVSEFMILTNKLKDQPKISQQTWEILIKLLAPFAPFLAEELWQEITQSPSFSKESSVHWQKWPEFDENMTKSDTVMIGVQINGKIRGELKTDDTDTETSVLLKIEKSEKLKKYLGGQKIKKIIYIPARIINVLV